MFNVCSCCGMYEVRKEIVDGKYAKCPHCGQLHPVSLPPLFILTGASGAGKSALANLLCLNNRRVISLDSDILWNDSYNTPEDNYRSYREMWLRMCKNISQEGMPVILCGCATPEQFESCDERRYFSKLHYLAVVCEDEVLEHRLKSRPEWRGCGGTEYIKGACDFNRYLKEHAADTKSPIRLLDNSSLTLEEEYRLASQWIDSILDDR